jgi:gluconolactonase
MSGFIFRYEWKNGAFGSREVFTNVIDPAAPPGWKGPDGMKFGLDGNLYCTVYAQGDVTVVNSQGVVIRRIKTDGKFPTNLTFGAYHEKRIYVTEIVNNAIEVHDVDTEARPDFWATPFAV